MWTAKIQYYFIYANFFTFKYHSHSQTVIHSHINTFTH